MSAGSAGVVVVESRSGGTTKTPDRAALLAFLALWFGMVLWALLFVRAYAAPFPFGDEFALWDLLPPSGSLSLQKLWSLKNEHRIPLPRLVQYVPYVLTGDLRAPMYVQVLVLAAVALSLALVARAIRGRTSLSDATFPLLWLHVGNSANLLAGFQLALTLPTAFVTFALGAIAISSGLARGGRAAVLGGSLVCLPLCGAAGLVQAPALGAWIAGLGWAGRRSPDPGERRAIRILLLSVAACALLCALHFRGYDPAHWNRYSDRPFAVIEAAAQLACLGFGPAAEVAWPAIAVPVLALLVATILLLVLGLLRRSPETRRRVGLLASMAGIASLVGSIGIGRAAMNEIPGFTPRYVTLTAPLLCCAYFAWMLYGRGRWKTIVCAAIAIGAAAALPWNAKDGYREGRELKSGVDRFESLVLSGAGTLELVESFTEIFPFHFPGRSREVLRTLALGRKAPFDRRPPPDAANFDYLTFSRPPVRIEGRVASDEPPQPRFVDGRHSVLVRPGTALVFELGEGERRISGRFGIPGELLRGVKIPTVRVVVLVRPRDGAPRTLLDRTLAPGSNRGDRRSHEFRFDLPQDAPGEIELRAEEAGGPRNLWSWSYWSDVRIE